MFGTIRKHQTWLWIFIIGITILGMIVWTNNTGNANRRQTGNFGSIDNKPITAMEMEQAQHDVMLMFLVNSRPHQWPDTTASQSDFQRQAYQQVYIRRRMNDYNIHADAEAAAHLATRILGGWDENGPITMEKFLEVLKTKGLSAEDFEHYLEGYVAMEQLETIVGLSGKVVTPEEIQSLYVEQYQDLAAEAVFFSASNNLAKIPAPTPEALAQFYTNQQATYREPDKMQLSYVYYNVTNFMPQAEQQIGTNLTREVDEALTRLGTNSIRFGKTAEEARAKVREIFVQQTAQSNAYVLARSFQDEVAKQTNIAQNFAAFAKSKGLEAKVTKPFDKEFGPSEINLGSGYPVANLFELNNTDEQYLPPIRGTDGVYVFAFNKLIPSHIPSLAEIHDRVESDYKFEQALNIAKVNGRSFAQTVTNEMAHGKTFAQTCEAVRVTPVQLPPFSLSTPRLPEVEDRLDLNEFKNTAFGTPVGSVSRFTETPDGGFIVYVRQRLPVDQTKMKTQLPEFANLVRQRRQTDAFNIWFSQGWVAELNRGLRDVPALRRQ